MATLEQINQVVEQESKFVESVLAEMGQVVVGQRAILERLLIGVLTGGHILIEGVPGLAKTLIIPVSVIGSQLPPLVVIV